MNRAEAFDALITGAGVSNENWVGVLYITLEGKKLLVKDTVSHGTIYENSDIIALFSVADGYEVYRKLFNVTEAMKHCFRGGRVRNIKDAKTAFVYFDCDDALSVRRVDNGRESSCDMSYFKDGEIYTEVNINTKSDEPIWNAFEALKLCLAGKKLRCDWDDVGNYVYFDGTHFIKHVRNSKEVDMGFKYFVMGHLYTEVQDKQTRNVQMTVDDE